MAEAVIVYEASRSRSKARRRKHLPSTSRLPLGPIEKEDLSWYLERYITWPVEYYQEQAKEV